MFFSRSSNVVAFLQTLQIAEGDSHPPTTTTAQVPFAIKTLYRKIDGSDLVEKLSFNLFGGHFQNVDESIEIFNLGVIFQTHM